MQYTPPHSPDPHPHPHPPHAHFAKIPMEHHHSQYQHQHQHQFAVERQSSDVDLGQGIEFAKRPISPPLSSGEISDCQSRQGHGHGHAPVSLLTALMHSPTSNPTSSGMLSPHSSVPSTAVSSPHLRPVSVSASQSHSNTQGLGSGNGVGQVQGGLDVPAMSILRRDSISSDGEMMAAASQLQGQGQGQGQARPQVQPQQVKPGDASCEMVKRASSLKFAVAPPLKRRSPSAAHVHATNISGDHHPAPGPKFDTPPPTAHRDDPEESPSASINHDEDEMDVDLESDEDENEDEDDPDAEFDMDREEEEEAGSEESDLGYQEDSEQSDDEDAMSRVRTGPKYPFARPVNYRRRQRDPAALGTPSPSPPPAPAVLPPPSRRGRGHIRVDESCISGKETDGTGAGGIGMGMISGKEKGCSRHRSPPPSKPSSRSGSRNRSRSRRPSEDAGTGTGLSERIGRLSDAGPRQNRAGSPMPSKSKIMEATDAEAELEIEMEDDEDEELPSAITTGGRGQGVYGQIGRDVFGSWTASSGQGPAPASSNTNTNPGLNSGLRDGWRSDDAAFYGPSSIVKGIRTASAPHHQHRPDGSALVSDEDMDQGEGVGSGVRSFFRRASEHLPVPTPIFGTSASANTGNSNGMGRRISVSHSHGHTDHTGRALSPGLCPPALDDTPALAHSISRVEMEHSGGLAHRLEKSLSTRERSRGQPNQNKHAASSPGTGEEGHE